MVTTFNGSYLCPILIPEKIAIGMEIRYHIIESTIPAVKGLLISITVTATLRVYLAGMQQNRQAGGGG
ncbi:hypothetical protein SEN1985_21410 [Salmonella enterica subsp. enterica serovar Kentucky]|nr:hypothetical protein SEN1985_21410 [Salmonella enterica subsp. enterica serovar Kentucky]